MRFFLFACVFFICSALSSLGHRNFVFYLKAFMVPSRILIFLCLLHLCVQGIQGNVNTAALAKMIKYFNDNVQPRTKPDVQYAIAISVPQSQCTDENSDIQTVFREEDAANVKNILTRGEKCVLCTPSQNVIAARPTSEPVKHSEHFLLYPAGNSPMDKLLAKADQDSCIVFYSYNSPCVTRCILSDDKILPGLEEWKKIKQKKNVFVFKNIWHKDAWRKDLDKELLQIDAIVPLYRCDISNNVMGCKKCEEKKNKKEPFCPLD